MCAAQQLHAPVPVANAGGQLNAAVGALSVQASVQRWDIPDKESVASRANKRGAVGRHRDAEHLGSGVRIEGVSQVISERRICHRRREDGRAALGYAIRLQRYDEPPVSPRSGHKRGPARIARCAARECRRTCR